MRLVVWVLTGHEDLTTGIKVIDMYRGLGLSRACGKKRGLLLRTPLLITIFRTD